jgi:hypothetical protein
MGKMKKVHLSEDYVREIVNRHTVFAEESWEISYHKPKKQSSRKSDGDWSKLKTHISK